MSGTIGGKRTYAGEMREGVLILIFWRDDSFFPGKVVVEKLRSRYVGLGKDAATAIVGS